MLPRLTLPPNPATLALIALAFALPGLAGHDLWKTHDAIGLGIVHDMATSGAPLVPRIAGTPWLFDPPLYHWLAAGFGSALQFFTEFHSGRAPGERRAGARGLLVDLRSGARRSGGARRPPHQRRRRDAGAAGIGRPHGARARGAARARLPRRPVRRLAVLPHAARRPLAAGAAARRRARLRGALGDLDRARHRCSPPCSLAHLVVPGMAHAERADFCWLLRRRDVSFSPPAGRWSRLARARRVRALAGRRLAADRRSARQPALLPRHRQLVRVPRLAARRLGGMVRCAGAGASRASSCPRWRAFSCSPASPTGDRRRT